MQIILEGDGRHRCFTRGQASFAPRHSDLTGSVSPAPLPALSLGILSEFTGQPRSSGSGALRVSQGVNLKNCLLQRRHSTTLQCQAVPRQILQAAWASREAHKLLTEFSKWLTSVQCSPFTKQ